MFGFGYGDAGQQGVARYTLSSTPRTTDEAIQAYVLLMESARVEDPANRHFYRAKMNAAPAAYKGMSVVTILRIAAATVRPATQTYGVAMSLLGKAGGAYTSTPVATAAERKKAVSTIKKAGVDTSTTALDVAADGTVSAGTTPFYKQSWFLPAAVLGGVGLIGLVVLGRK